MCFLDRGSVGNLTPETRCYECNDDKDCDEGQYCQLENGIEEADDGTLYKASSFLDRTMGLCHEKSTDVLGKRCRTDEASTFDSSKTPFDTEVFQGRNDGYAGGFGFCGEVLSFNSTGIADQGLEAGFDYDQDKTVYKVLWTGKCLNNICFECNPDDTESDGVEGKECINGRIRNAVHVDFTTRTFTQNVQAELLLSIMMIVVGFILCFSCQMMADANRHREFFKADPMSTKAVFMAICCRCLPCCKKRPDYLSGKPGENGAPAVAPDDA